MTTDLVICSYRADLSWVVPLAENKIVRVLVDDKWDGEGRNPDRFRGLNGAINLKLTRRPNVGRCDETYLNHIVTRYDELADWTVFSTDGPHGDLPEGSAMADAMLPGPSLRVPWILRTREWGPDGRLPWHLWTNRPHRSGVSWAEHYASGKIARAELSFVEWMRRFVGFDVDGPDWPGYAPGAGVYAVPKRAITYLPKAFYARLRDQLSHHNEPEAAHFCERSWVTIFSGRARYQEAT